MDFGFRYPEYLCDQLKSFVVGAGLIAGIESAELFKVLKLIDLVFRLPVDIYLRSKWWIRTFSQ